jgi:hypothetical protein
MASKLGGAYKKPREYLLNSVEAFFLQQRQGGAASLLDMAEMFALKFQKDGLLDSEAP